MGKMNQCGLLLPFHNTSCMSTGTKADMAFSKTNRSVCLLSLPSINPFSNHPFKSSSNLFPLSSSSHNHKSLKEDSLVKSNFPTQSSPTQATRQYQYCHCSLSQPH